MPRTALPPARYEHRAHDPPRRPRRDPPTRSSPRCPSTHSIERPVLGLRAIPAPRNRNLQRAAATGLGRWRAHARAFAARVRPRAAPPARDAQTCRATRALPGGLAACRRSELPAPRALPEGRRARRTQALRSLHHWSIVGNDAAGAGFHIHSVAYLNIASVDGLAATAPAPPQPPRHDCRNQPSGGDSASECGKQAAVDRFGMARQEVRRGRRSRVGIGVGGCDRRCVRRLGRTQVTRERDRRFDARPWSVRVVVGHGATP